MSDTAVIKAASPFVVMAKPAGSLCNQRCEYCYYLGTAETLHNAEAGHMSDELLETFIRSYIESSPGPVVSFTWHGGEPTIAGLDFYRRAVRLQKKYLPSGWSCWNNLQTNGLLLDDEWCQFLAEEHFDVGLSMDGDAENHDLMRHDVGGHGTYERVLAAAQRLMGHGIRPDLLCTVTSFASKRPLEIYRALRALNTGWIQFIPIIRRNPDGTLTEDSVTGEQYGSFLCEIFDEWVRSDIGRLDVQLFAETALVWAGGEPSLCWMSQTCGRALIVERDGGVYSCDHFVDLKHRLGSITERSLGEYADAPEQLAFGANKHERLPAKCRSCAYLKLCGGGCPKDREGEPEGRNVLCSGLYQFFSHSERQMKLIASLRRRGASNDTIRTAVRNDLLEMWRGVGRNDPCPCGSGKKAKKCCWDKRPV